MRSASDDFKHSQPLEPSMRRMRRRQRGQQYTATQQQTAFAPYVRGSIFTTSAEAAVPFYTEPSSVWSFDNEITPGSRRRLRPRQQIADLQTWNELEKELWCVVNDSASCVV